MADALRQGCDCIITIVRFWGRRTLCVCVTVRWQFLRCLSILYCHRACFCRGAYSLTTAEQQQHVPGATLEACKPHKTPLPVLLTCIK